MMTTANFTNVDQGRSIPRITRILHLASFACVLGATALALFAPMSTTAVTTNNGQQFIYTSTLLQSQGASILLPLLIPLAIALIPLVSATKALRTSSIVSAILLMFFAVIASASIGWFYLPAAILAMLYAFTSLKGI